MNWKPGDRVRIKTHEHVSCLIWGKFATVVQVREHYNDRDYPRIVCVIDGGETVRLWCDQIEQDILGELATL